MSKQLQKINSENYLKIAGNDLTNRLLEEMPEHKQMLEVISKNLPEITRATSLHGKTQSQFMDNSMTVNHYTPLRNLRQILAQITSTKSAVQENGFKIKKKEVEIKIKERDVSLEKDELKGELLKIEIDEIKDQIENSKLYLSGAIRTLANYTEQYNNIIKAYGIGEWNEDDFEAEEEKYHIMKAFEQAYCAAISHGGTIDEGNFIYLTQLGINGMSAQFEMEQYLRLEQAELHNGITPSHTNFQNFLERMAEKYKGCSGKLAEKKGMHIFSATASLKEGDKTLFDKNKRPKHVEVMRKLYALCKSTNENEAKSAHAKLLKMQKKYNVEEADLL